jgi:cellulose synthase/poly-beta-1,6-N-acetylglucosamine synthase-like glycosyltransferase
MIWFPVILILPYLFVILKCYSNLLRLKSFNVTFEPEIFVSVVVACRNEQNNLTGLLKSIASQNYPGNLFEVIIVNDSSADETSRIAEKFKGIRHMIVLDNVGAGKKQALRTGITAAKGNLIITTDADCRMGPNWIRTISAFYELKKPDMIICPVQIKSAHGFFAKFQQLEFLSLQGITAGTAYSGAATMCNGANLAFTREAYLQHSDDLHDEIKSGDDVFFLHSLKKENQSRILWLESSDAQVITEPAPTLKSFIRQRSRWISKGQDYKDGHTIALGIITFVTIMLITCYLIGWLIYPRLVLPLLAILVLKLIPDFLILLNTANRYGKIKLMVWFLPVGLIYPFYAISVVFYYLISKRVKGSQIVYWK